jgi:hypothetical protein
LALVLRLVPVLLLRDLPIGLDDMFQYAALARWAPVVVAVFPLLVVYPLALASENLLIPLLTLALAPWTGHSVDRVTTRKLGVGAGAGLGHLGRALWP